MAKPLFNKVCIVGVGLIGGSLGNRHQTKKNGRLVMAWWRRGRPWCSFPEKSASWATMSLKEGVVTPTWSCFARRVHDRSADQALRPLLQPTRS